MKNQKFFIFLTIFLFLAFILLPAKTFTKSGEAVTLDDSIKMEKNKNTLPIELIGWSKDGKFAYTEKWENSWKPSSGTAYIIFDAVNDVKIFDKSVEKYDTDDKAELNRINEENKKNLKDFEQALLDNRISKMKLAIEDFPISSDYIPIQIAVNSKAQPVKENVSCIIKVSYEADSVEESSLGNVLTWNYQVIVNSKSYEKTVSKGTDNQAIYKRVVGFYKSPNERRIAILIDTYFWGIENEHYHVYNFIGCNMNVGFTQKK